jgi:hypothetical protein
MLTDSQFCRWAESHLDLTLDLGDLAAAIESSKTIQDRWGLTQKLAERLLPDSGSLLNSRKCDTLSFDEVQELKRCLLANLTERAVTRRDYKALAHRTLDWLENTHAVVRLLLHLIEPMDIQ